MFNGYEFMLAYRMEHNTFKKLLSLVRPRLQKNIDIIKRAGRPAPSPEARLGIFPSRLGGEWVAGCMQAFEAGRSTVYHIHETKAVLNHK